MAVGRIVSFQILALAVTYSAVSAASGGFFAKSAVPLGDGPVPVVDLSRVSVSAVRISDDAVEGFPAILRVTVGGRQFDRRFDFGLNAEVLWSPDPNRFAVTGSKEGANGQYRTAVVNIAPTGLKWVEVTARVERSFGHPERCGWPEVPNVVAVTWLSRTRLVLADKSSTIPIATVPARSRRTCLIWLRSSSVLRSISSRRNVAGHQGWEPDWPTRATSASGVRASALSPQTTSAGSERMATPAT